MTQYGRPVHIRLLKIMRNGLNQLADSLRRPVLNSSIVLVAGRASPAKISDIKERVQFLLACIGVYRPIIVVPSCSISTYVRSQAIVVADSKAVPAFAREHARWIADLDNETNPMDGWALVDLARVFTSRTSQKRHERAGQQALLERVKALNADRSRPVYLFGTGPSLQLAADRSFSDGLRIVCNTVVRDAQLWHHISPHFLVAGDAIYHFDNTAHARAFRADALQRLTESDGATLFVYPAMFDVIVRREFRAVESLLVPIPWGEHTDVSVDLTRNFTIPPLGNVLCNLLLPLGCTLSKDIRLWGFDGRSPNDTGFWANSNRQAYPELMQSIRDAHPAFFSALTPKGREEKYVEEVHGNVLDERLTEAENRGFSFRMLHHSWTPTLRKRYRAS